MNSQVDSSLRLDNFQCSEHGYIKPEPVCPKCARIRIESIYKIVDGLKEVDSATLIEKPHTESCCNETLDDLLKALNTTLYRNNKTYDN